MFPRQPGESLLSNTNHYIIVSASLSPGNTVWVMLTTDSSAFLFSATELIEGGGAFPDQPGQSLTYKNTVTAGGVNGKVIGFINGYFIVTAAATKTEEAWFQQTQTVVFTAGPHAGSTITIAGTSLLTNRARCICSHLLACCLLV